MRAAAAPAADGWMHTLSAVISTDVPPPARGTSASIQVQSPEVAALATPPLRVDLHMLE